MTQTTKNGTSIVWVDITLEWYEDAMVFRVFIFIFLFRNNGKNGHLNENDFQLCSNFLLDNNKGHWQQHFERDPTVQKDLDTLLFFHQDLSKHGETETDEGGWKVISCIKIRFCTSKNIAKK